MKEILNKRPCNTCGIEKELYEFGKCKTSKDGHILCCRKCRSIKGVEWGKKNKERHNELNRAWKSAHRDAAHESNRKSRIKNKGNGKEYFNNKMWREKNMGKWNAMKRRHDAFLIQAIPKWADMGKIKEVYSKSIEMNKAGSVKYHVDHIVPLNSELVCGLHVHFNLQVITASENIRKQNRYWPDMPTAELSL